MKLLDNIEADLTVLETELYFGVRQQLTVCGEIVVGIL